ncbi:SDR family oxidoreductase [Promicromonospora thailandica]|uniref:NADP-dependent 3-hydroxy acid dehydrogenase YdfG n=1 Tax=Promicromonospora thailandica TaxID=765201 RepID=A0A9X2GEG9_9MICO|nr:SDR family oxidoreductase [Promicromonospora thailandica]MCP2267096.1 NADP-dependent 3-hydroxy acid dehydrogenase YdfG [Promicromonospora thailandica]BFF16617.1 SDR family oxidoreductase [Promicromonospora thailandica]
MQDSATSDTGGGIAGKVIAVTGASGGIGAAIAERLAAGGATLLLGARRVERLQDVVGRIRSAGGTATAVPVDVRRRADLVRLVAAAQEEHGRLDVLVANAGSMATSRFDELRQDDWDDVVATNLTGVLNGVAAALPVFRAQGSGHFVHLASTSAHRIVPTQGVYAATKTAVRVLSEALRQEAGPDLRVTVVSPGLTRTEGTLSAGEEMAAWVDAVAQPADAVARAVAYAVEQPAGVDVGEIIVRPTAQD